MSERTEALRQFEGKSVKLETISGLFYHTRNLLVVGEMLVFTDRIGMKVSIPIEQLKQIQEMARW